MHVSVNERTTLVEGEDYLDRASWFIEDAFSGISRPHPVQTPFARTMYTLYSELHYVRGITLIILLGLEFFEIPTWCHNYTSTYPCGIPTDPRTPPTFNIAFLSYQQSILIESTCLIVLLGISFIRYLYLQENFTKRKDNVIYTSLLGILLIFLFLRFLWPNGYSSHIINETSGYLRVVLFMIQNRSLRKTLQNVWLVLAEVQHIVSVLVVFLFFFAWVGVILFQKTEEGRQYMPNISDAAWNLLVTLTTANFPDVMMPAYTQNRISIIFFACFLCFGLFFLMNVVLAVIFDHFSRHVNELQTKRDTTREQKLHIAFNLLCQVPTSNKTSLESVSFEAQALQHKLSSTELWEHRHDDWFLGKPSPTDTINLQVMIRLFHKMNHYKNITFIQPSKMPLLFDTLDTKRCGALSWTEFKQICDVLPLTLATRETSPSEIERWWPSLYMAPWFQRVCGFVLHARFDFMIDLVLLSNTAVVMIETLPILNGDTVSAEEEIDKWEHVEAFFSLVYVIELISKLLVLGISKYWFSIQNRFDCILTIAIIAVDIYAYMPQNAATFVVVKILLIARCLRLCRLVSRIEKYRIFFGTLIRLLPFAKNVLLTMFTIIYLFALFGQQLFGGKISPQSISKYPTSTFTQSNYSANNFNDLSSGFVTLFELLVINNWHVIVDGHVLVTSKWSRWFFIFYYLVSVVLLLNLVIASILEAFADEYKKQREIIKASFDSVEINEI